MNEICRRVREETEHDPPLKVSEIYSTSWIFQDTHVCPSKKRAARDGHTKLFLET